MESWIQRRDNFYSRLKTFCSEPGTLISSASGSVVITHNQFDGFEGKGEPQPYAALGLCMGGGGRTYRKSEQVLLDDVWSPGRVGLALPGPAAEGITPPLDMLLIAFDLNDVPACHGEKPTTDDLRRVASSLFDDKLVASVMISLLHDAEAHGAASAFFDHGLSLILQRLVTLSKTHALPNKLSSVSQHRLGPAFDLIEACLDDDLRVKSMAAILDLDERTFTRMFKKDTGYTPYKYLTMRRMERAKQLLKMQTSVTDTATAVGYANPAKFAAAFRRWVGKTPSEWRQSE